MALTTDKRFIDLDIDFKRHPVTGDVVRVYDEKAVEQSIFNLLLTRPYDVPFQPSKGSNIHGVLFEPVSPFAVAKLRSVITETITKWEPRANLHDVTVTIADSEDAYNVTIIFTLINSTYPTKITFVLDRIR